MRLDRSFYIPARSQKFTFKAAGATVYAYDDSQGRPCARIFIGRQSKPAYAHRYDNEAARKAHVLGVVETLATNQARRQADRDARKGAHSLKVGDILYTSGGYEQTRVSFYEVVAVTPSTVQIYAIHKETLDGAEYSYWRVAPVPGSHITTKRAWRGEECVSVPVEPMRVRIDRENRGTLDRQGLSLHCRRGEPVGSRSESGHH